MLRKKYRLKNRSSFQYIYRRGKSTSSTSVVLQYIQAKNLKIGFSVSKKIGNSVVRNKVKRRMRESAQLLIPRIKKGYNCIFVAKPQIASVGFTDILSDMTNVLTKADLLTEDKV